MGSHSGSLSHIHVVRAITEHAWTWIKHPKRCTGPAGVCMIQCMIQCTANSIQCMMLYRSSRCVPSQNSVPPLSTAWASHMHRMRVGSLAHPSLCPSVPPSLSVCLPVCLPSLSPCLPFCLPVCLSVSLSPCLSPCLSVCLSVCLPVCLPVCRMGVVDSDSA
jgi:hypothetical protein